MAISPKYVLINDTCSFMQRLVLIADTRLMQHRTSIVAELLNTSISTDLLCGTEHEMCN